MQDHRDGDGGYGNRIYLYEERTDRKNLHRSGVGVPYFVFFPESEDGAAGNERRAGG